MVGGLTIGEYVVLAYVPRRLEQKVSDIATALT